MQLLHRRADSCKADYGHIFILAGSPRFSGAAVLCAEAALRSGAGLVTLGIPKGLNSAIIKIKPREAMTLPLPQTRVGTLSLAAFKEIKIFSKDTDVIVIGPGLSRNKETLGLVRKVITGLNQWMVIDADGLNALAGRLSLLRVTDYRLRVVRVLTPHPGEMARLLGISIDRVQSNRKTIAREFARDYKVTMVLKGHHTVVADKQSSCYINNTGNPGMSTAGSGDVLSGMIAALLGQGLTGFLAAKCAVYLHGLAGDLAAKEKTELCLIASDIIDKIPQAVKLSS